MIALLQRVSRARVDVDDECVGSIARGLLVLAGVERGDTSRQAARLAEKTAAYRVFPDSGGRMNLSVADIGGQILLVPQFTLAADTSRGLRPSFTRAADPEAGRRLFDELAGHLRGSGLDVQTGRFGADMQVSLTNEGPVTFWLEVGPENKHGE